MTSTEWNRNTHQNIKLSDLREKECHMHSVCDGTLHTTEKSTVPNSTVDLPIHL